MELEPQSELLKRYTVEALIDGGKQYNAGMRYRCFDKKHNRTIVAKFPYHGLAALDPAERARFVREFELLSQLNHNNIIKVYELHETKDCLFFTMEHLEGFTLAKLIADLNPNALKTQEHTETALALLRELADALHAVHELGYIHHCLSPATISLVPVMANGKQRLQVKLHGLENAIEQHNHTEKEARVGYLLYQSPEQYRGEKLENVSDIFSWGLIAYEVLNGAPPFPMEGEEITWFELTRARDRNCVGDVPDIRNTHRKVRRAINTMVQVCLRKEPEWRYSNAGMLVEQIEDILSALESPSLIKRVLQESGASADMTN